MAPYPSVCGSAVRTASAIKPLIITVMDSMTKIATVTRTTTATLDARNCQRPAPLLNTGRRVPQPYSPPITAAARITAMKGPKKAENPRPLAMFSVGDWWDTSLLRVATNQKRSWTITSTKPRTIHGTQRRRSLNHSQRVSVATCIAIAITPPRVELLIRRLRRGSTAPRTSAPRSSPRRRLRSG